MSWLLSVYALYIAFIIQITKSYFELPYVLYLIIFRIQECYAEAKDSSASINVVSLESKLCGNRYLNVKRELSESKSIAISFRSFQLISTTQEEMFLPFFCV